MDPRSDLENCVRQIGCAMGGKHGQKLIYFIFLHFSTRNNNASFFDHVAISTFHNARDTCQVNPRDRLPIFSFMSKGFSKLLHSRL